MFRVDPHPIHDGNEVRGVVWDCPCWETEGGGRRELSRNVGWRWVERGNGHVWGRSAPHLRWKRGVGGSCGVICIGEMEGRRGWLRHKGGAATTGCSEGNEVDVPIMGVGTTDIQWTSRRPQLSCSASS